METTDAEIERRIWNNHGRYALCAFASCRSGMEDFARLSQLFPRIDDGRLWSYLDAIDEVLASQEHCLNCSAKILAFCEIFAAGKFPDRHAEYQRRYDALVPRRRLIAEPRDYRFEVRCAISRAASPPAQEELGPGPRVPDCDAWT